MAQNRFPLGRTEQKLQDRVQALLGEGEQVEAAVIAFTGPRAGVEVLLAPLIGLLSLFTNVCRRFTTIAITNEGVVLLETTGLRRPVRVRARFATLDALGPINDTVGDPWIQVDGTRYWTEGIWSPQLYVIRQLQRGTSSTR